MWIMVAPSSTARRASAAYSSGLYGIAGHWSRFATAPEMAQVIRTGSSTAMGSSGVGRSTPYSDRPHADPQAWRRPTLGYPGRQEATPDRKDPTSMLGEIIAAIVIGIIAGYLGRALLPGDDSMGFVATIAVGIVGALVGYFLFTSLLGIGDSDKFDLGGIIGAIVGTMIVLLILRAVRGSGRGGATRGRAV